MRFSPPARIGTVVPGKRRNFEASVLRIVAALTIAAVATACTRKEPPAVSESKRALNVAPAIGDFAVYGDNSVVIRDRVQIAGGDVGVRKKGTTGPFLFSGYELAITSDAKVEASRSVIGGRVLLQDRAVVGHVQTTQLTNQSGSYSGLYPFPATMPQLPALAEVTPGTVAVSVAMHETRTLDPGPYGAVSVAYQGVLRLRAGIYHWASLQLGDESRIEALGPVQIRIAGRISTLARVSVVGASGTNLTAKDIRIEVSGRNGTSGTLSDTPVAAAWGNDATLHAVMLVPNGTLAIGQRALLTGAVAARDVSIDIDSRPVYQSGLGPIQCSPPSCDDSNPCTADACVNGVCSHVPVAAGTSCSDGNACNGSELCDATGHCLAGTPVVCSASDQCHDTGVCDPATGICSNPAKPDGTSCDDQNSCTQSDTCQVGACVGAQPVDCVASDQCHAAGTCDPATGVCSSPIKADGTACNDGDACTQSDTCQAGTCTGTNPVTCAASDQCHVAGTCDPATGVCSNPAKDDGTLCNDGNACTQVDACLSGTCVGTSPVVCTALDQCHAPGACDPGTGVCSNPAKDDGTTCNDGNACTRADSCQGGACIGANPVVCTASDQCHNSGTCDTRTGLCSNPAKPDGTTCNDANACTRADTCQAGACVGANPVTCAASDQCHVAGTCDPSSGLCSDPAKSDGTECDDDDACTQSDSCKAGKCEGANPVVCAPSDQCHEAGTCDSSTGTCSNPVEPEGTACNDGNLCTLSDACIAGTCVGSNPVACVATDQCHVAGVCDPNTGVCSNPAKPDGSNCNDGNACTQVDSCQAGACMGANPIVCNASDQCHAAGTCDPASGLCSNPEKPDGSNCNDGNACTQVDSCQAGACMGANPISCTASDLCHEAGQCDPTTGACSNPVKADGASCDDGNACTRTDQCLAGGCVGANPVVCSASDQCHNVGVCNSATGLCSNPAKADGTGCDDGSVCTQTDTCQSGLCTGANPVTCVASDQCHSAGVCDPATGCSNPVKSDGSVCNDGNACTRTDACQAGTCVGGNAVVCEASDQCHEAGTCDSESGACTNPIKANGTACEDGNACTRSDTCQNGNCAGGNPVVCAAKDQCHTVGSCDLATGICSDPVKADGDSCNDANACTRADTCQAGTCVGSDPVVCAATDQCHDVGTCDSATGQCRDPAKPDGSLCDDGSSSTTGDQCIAGVCKGTTCVRVAKVAMGGVAGAAVWSDGSLWIFGWGGWYRPSKRPGDGWANFSLSAGYTACGTKVDGSLWCFGVNGNGQVGDGTTETRNSFVEIAGGPWAKVTMGATHGCAVTQAGTIKCWGYNSNGQLGDGTTTQRLSPVLVAGTNWVEVSGGTSHTCALKGDGTLWCWGLNSSGQLGDGTTNQRLSPVTVAGANWASVTTGVSHSCGTRSDGTLWCWGSNGNGELGIGTTGGVRNAPVQVPGTGWTSVSAGRNGTCGTKSDGSGYCWGLNTDGSVGDGTLTNRNTPTALPGTGWAQIRSSNGSACALKQDGSVWTWGFNDSGQLGVGSTARSVVPVQIGLSGCLGTCGDGRSDWSEQCDDGNTATNDGCRPDCKREICGDGVLQNQVGVRSLEITWLGRVSTGDREVINITINGSNAVTDTGLNTGCWGAARRITITDPAILRRIANGPNQFVITCTGQLSWVKARVYGKQVQDVVVLDAGGGGDAESGNLNTCVAGTVPAEQWLTANVNITVAGEDCDDGNSTNGDGCSSTCGSGTCGNRVIDSGEECDDGNSNNNDGCSSTCKQERCGDLTVQSGEECDDGNTLAGDRCSSTCKTERCFGKTCPNCYGCVEPTGACTLPLPDGTACNDGDACTQVDTCQSQKCIGSDPIVCRREDCQVPLSCDPATGLCRSVMNGTACDDRNACTLGDTCTDGKCNAGTQVRTCPAPDQCREAGVCLPATGDCWYSPSADGRACNDGDACTRVDSCLAGACTGSDLVTCTAADQCHVPGACNPTTGTCGASPAKPDGSECNDLNACTRADTCVGGACIGGSPVICALPATCATAGSCDPGSGLCSPAAQCSTCGDGVVGLGETCDDGNVVPGDGCNAECKKEFCGDGVRQQGIGVRALRFSWLARAAGTSDSANIDFAVNGVSVPRITTGGLSSACVQEIRSALITDSAIVSAVHQGSNQFAVTSSGEIAWAKVHVIGGAPVDVVILDANDGGDAESEARDTCLAGVSPAGENHAASAEVQAGEECDDGNTHAGDGCSPTCAVERCGDGFVGASEECDDWNTSDGDGCSASCQWENAAIGVESHCTTSADQDAPATTIQPLGPSEAHFGETMFFGARLVTTSAAQQGLPLAGRELRFQVGSQTVIATTTAQGVARAAMRIGEAPGTHILRISFAGDAAGDPTEASSTVSVRKAKLRVRLTAPALVAVGQPTNLAALVTDDDQNPVAGRTVSITALGAPASANTDAAGVATVALPAPSAAGLSSIELSVAGDAEFEAGQDTASLVAFATAEPPALANVNVSQQQPVSVRPGESFAVQVQIANASPTDLTDAAISEEMESLTPPSVSEALGAIASGQTVTKSFTVTAPTIAPRGADESLAAYIQRLGEADGRRLRARGRVAFLDPAGGTRAVDVVSSSWLYLPRVQASLQAPLCALPGALVQYVVGVGNIGSAEARQVIASLSLPDGSSVTLDFGVLASGASASRTYAWQAPTLGAHQPGETQQAYLARMAEFARGVQSASVDVSWKDELDNNYSPTNAEVATARRLPVLTSSAVVQGSVLPGQPFDIAFTVSNVGNAPAVAGQLSLAGGAASPALALAPGESVSFTLPAVAPALEPRGALESDLAYAARLRALDGSVLAQSFDLGWHDLAGQAFGPVPGQARTTYALPVLALSVSGPTEAIATDPLAYTVKLQNLGHVSASASLTLTLPDGTEAHPFAAGVPLNAGQTTEATVMWNVPAAQKAGLVAASARATWLDSRAQEYGPLSTSVATRISAINQPPVVEAGPEQQISLPAHAILAGSASDDGLPAGTTVGTSWVQVSGPGTVFFTDPTSPTTEAVFDQPGAYVLRLIASDSQVTASDDTVVQVLPRAGAGTVISGGAPVPGETLDSLSRQNGQLGVSDNPPVFKFLWVAASTKGTVVKIDTTTGAVLGEYWTSPGAVGTPEFQPKNPSRTTVDHNGSVWVANRNGNSVARVALFENEGCVDRNGNGVIDTSHGLGDVKPWTNVGGADTNGGVSTAQDECIINYVRVHSSGTRHISVDANNDVWVSGIGSQVFDLIDGRTGAIKRSEGPVGYGGYGGIIDANGVIWSSLSLLRWDTALPLVGPAGVNWSTPGDGYGVCLDPSGNVWATSVRTIRKFSPSGQLLGNYPHGGQNSQGCAVSADGHVWVAHSLQPSAQDPASVGHLRPDGYLLGVVEVPRLSQGMGGGPTGVAVDADGNVWATNFETDFWGNTNGRAIRINPKLGPLGKDGVNRLGEVDMVTPALGGGLYNYSDMTGSQLRGHANVGKWSFVYDSRISNAAWGKIAWKARVCGDASIKFTAASSADGTSFSQPVALRNGDNVPVPNGRYLKVAATFKRSSKHQSPLLYEMAIGTADYGIEVPANHQPLVSVGPERTAAITNPTRLTGSACDDASPVATGLDMQWSKVSGPGAVTFKEPGIEATDLTFSEPGQYVLRLNASDSVLADHADVTVNVVRPNYPPVITMTTPLAVNLPNAVSLAAVATDDGLPAGSALVTTWTKVSGPGEVAFVNASDPGTTATFTVAGSYVLRLTADDGQMPVSKDMVVLVNPAAGANLPPVVTAGPNSTVDSGATAQLAGSVTDDGLPSATTSCQWSQVSGPGTVTFATPDNPTSTATFTADGNYILALTCTDSVLSAKASVELGVGVSNSANQPPQVAAGPNVALSLPNGTATLLGAATDDGLPADKTLAVSWSQLSGPSAVVFGDPTQAVTTAKVGVAGTYLLRLTASDGQHSVWADTALVASTAPAANSPPVVTMPADLTVVLPLRGATLSPSVVDDGLPAGLTYSWTSVAGPSGAVLATLTALSTTVTLPATPGIYVFRLTASDGQLSSSSTIRVILKPASSENQLPVVNAGAPITVGSAVASSVQLAGTVTDDGLPAGVALTTQWTQHSGPGTVSFADRNSPATTASFPLPGDYELELLGSDGEYLVTSDVVVHVLPQVVNKTPVVTVTGPVSVALPPGTAALTGSVRDDGLPVGESLQMAWTKISGPGVVTFSRPAQAATVATFSEEGTYVLQLEASDSLLTGFARLTVNVALSNTAPAVSAGPNQILAYPTRTATLVGTSSDDGRPSSSTLTTRWSMVSGAGPVAFSAPSALETQATFAYPGSHVLRLTASDGQLTSTSEVTVTVDAAPGVAPMVALTSPADGATLTAPTDVNGTVSGGEWKLEHRLGGEDSDAAWVTFASGTGAVSAAKLGRLDPTMMLNGIYAIRLTATSSEGTASQSIHVSVEKNLKIGNFTVSFSDLNVPVSGLPIEVVRTYDSRDKTSGDFGVGWNVSLRNIRVETSGILGQNWRQQQQPGFWPTYCLTQARPRFVTVTFPTGKVSRFRAVTDPECETFTTIAMAEMAFAPEAGTRGKLTTMAGAGLIATENTLLDSDGVVFNPTSFRFEAEDGMVYAIEKKSGLQWMQDRNGNTVRVTPTGVVHSSGRGILFQRDSAGRISKMIDPAGNALTYEYKDGLLTAVVDREGNRTTYAYTPDQKLKDIVDPLGKRALRNEYDDEGRLVRTIDVNDKAIAYTHNLAANQEIITDRMGAAKVLAYDNHGNVVQEQDAEGGLIKRTFDENDNRTSETVKVTDTREVTNKWKYEFDNVVEAEDALTNKTHYTYNAWNQVVTTKDPLNHTTTNTYDFNTGNLLLTKDALEHTTGFGYNRAGERISRTDRLNRPTGYTYDSFGNLETETDANGNVTRYTYDANGNRLSESRQRTKADGSTETLTTRFTYDKNGRLLSTRHPDGSTTSTTYTEAGQRETSTDGLGRVTRYTYDDLGRLITTLYPDNTTTESTYDREGRRLTSKDRAGRVTRMEYNQVGRLVKTTYPDNLAYTSTEYHANGWVKSTTDAGGHVTRYEYDDAGRQTKVIDALNGETTFTYDAAGNQLTVTDARQNTTTSVYDPLNRLVTTRFMDNSERSTTYDDEGQRIAETDQANKTTHFGYNPLGHLTSVTDALEHVTRYEYDEVGNRVKVIDAAGKETKFEYDPAGREIKRTLADGKFERKRYNLGGELVARTDFQNRETTFIYDEAGRLKAKTYPDESSVSFTYTKNGRRETAVDVRGTTRYIYDERDRLTSMEYPNGHKLEYGYDLEGRRTSLTAKVGATTLATSYGYDSLDRIATVTDPDTRAFGLEYDQVGSLDKLVRPNGVDTKYTHDRLNRLTNIRTYTRATDTTMASYAYTLGPTGIRTRIDEADGTVRAYEYDALYRLTKETVTGAQTYEKGFTYDEVSNRKTQTTPGADPGDPDAGVTGETINYTYDNRDRLTSENTTTYGWTDNGNLMSKAGDSYEWDFEDRLVKVTKADGTVVQNTYDADGVLVRTSVNGGATDLLVDTSGGLSQVVAEVDAGGAVGVVYVRAEDMLLEEIRGGVAKMYERDGLGSVRGLLDASGARTDVWTYEAFGTTLLHSGNSQNLYQFAGERYVGTVGMYQNRARWLDTGTGSFVSVDPLADLTGIPYVYAHADPLDRIDATGLADYNISSLLSAQTIQNIISTSTNIVGTAMRVQRGIAAIQTIVDYAELGFRLVAALAAPTPEGAGASAYSALSSVLPVSSIAEIDRSIRELGENIGKKRWKGMARRIQSAAPAMGTAIASKAVSRIPTWSKWAATDDLRLLFFLPTAPGSRESGETEIAIPKTPFALRIGTTGGRLFGFGAGAKRDSRYEQVFRVDYWEKTQFDLHYHIFSGAGIQIP